MFNANFALDIKPYWRLCFSWVCVCQKILLCCFYNSIKEIKLCWHTNCCMSVKSNRCGFPSLSVLKTAKSCCVQDTTFAFSLQNVPFPEPLTQSAIGALKRKRVFFYTERVEGHQTPLDQSSTFSFCPRCVINPYGPNPDSKLPYREQRALLRHTLNPSPLIITDLRVWYFTVISTWDD